MKEIASYQKKKYKFQSYLSWFLVLTLIGIVAFQWENK